MLCKVAKPKNHLKRWLLDSLWTTYLHSGLSCHANSIFEFSLYRVVFVSTAATKTQTRAGGNSLFHFAVRVLRCAAPCRCVCRALCLRAHCMVLSPHSVPVCCLCRTSRWCVWSPRCSSPRAYLSCCCRPRSAVLMDATSTRADTSSMCAAPTAPAVSARLESHAGCPGFVLFDFARLLTWWPLRGRVVCFESFSMWSCLSQSEVSLPASVADLVTTHRTRLSSVS
jgi:hypothetical protein